MSDTLDPSLQGLADCGCCAGNSAQTPATIFNREGLSRIAYRSGTHGDFKATLLAALSQASRAPLGELATRDDDDFTIALLDAWSTVSDVFTFYQEALANESYLRTATELASVIRLARLIGYETAPGVAAEAALAFTLDESAGAPTQTTIAAGTKVQSIPGPSETAQTYETVEQIEARVEWNAMRPLTFRDSVINSSTTYLYLAGVNTMLNVGDAILIVGDERDPSDGATVTYPATERWDVRVVQSVTTNADDGWTRITWEHVLGKSPILPAATNVRCYAFRQRAALFGHNAPLYGLLTTATTDDDADWPSTKFVIKNQEIDLDASYPKVVAGSWLALARQPRTTDADDRDYVELYKATRVSYPSRAEFALSGKVTRIRPDVKDHLDGDWFPLRDTYVFAQSEELEIADEPVTTSPAGAPSEGIAVEDGTLAPVDGQEITLEFEVPPLGTKQAVILTGKRARALLPASAAALTITTDAGEAVAVAPGESTIVYAPPAIQASGQITWRLRTDEGIEGTVTCDAATLQFTAAGDDDDTVSERVTVKSCAGVPTMITFNEMLKYSYDRTTLTIAANVADATHGETVEETAGSGNATIPFQRFMLRQPPLTYLRGTGEALRESTLEVRVDQVLWHEVDTLLDRGPDESVYITRRTTDGSTTVTFGDGTNGARLTTGQQNVRFKYRKGSGLDGMVAAGQLSQLLTRPLGVNAVANPLESEGSENAEEIADARTNAPLTVLTLGRVVSLQDYEDYARAYPSISKALATWTWDGRRKGVLLTVAGADGAAVEEGGQLVEDLVAALKAVGDPFVPIRVKSYRAASFELAAKILVDPDYLPDEVLADAREQLESRFSFSARAFGQPVMLSEVIAALQSVSGVVAVDVDHLQRTDKTESTDPAPRLFADLPTGGGPFDDPVAAELLTISTESLAQVTTTKTMS